MPDVYATIADTDASVQERLAGILEMRAADPQQRAMLDAYLHQIEFPQHARVLEIGCGTGAVTRVLARQGDVNEAVGIDPSPVFLATARQLTQEANVEYREGDGRALPFTDAEFDVVVLHTALCHIPEPAEVLAEAFRVARAGGVLAVFDGDYSTISVGLGDPDPLQDCVDAARAAFIHDAWLVRRLPALLRTAGFLIEQANSHGYLQLADPEYMLTLVDRGADTLVSWGTIGPDLCGSLKAEARRRAEDGDFFGFIGFTSFIARKPEARIISKREPSQ